MTNQQANEIMEIFESMASAYRGRLTFKRNERTEKFIDIKRQALIEIIIEINPEKVK